MCSDSNVISRGSSNLGSSVISSLCVTSKSDGSSNAIRCNANNRHSNVSVASKWTGRNGPSKFNANNRCDNSMIKTGSANSNDISRNRRSVHSKCSNGKNSTVRYSSNNSSAWSRAVSSICSSVLRNKDRREGSVKDEDGIEKAAMSLEMRGVEAMPDVSRGAVPTG